MIWIARDADGSLWLYDKKPKLTKTRQAWLDDSRQGYILEIRSSKYPEVTFENSPQPLYAMNEKIDNYD